MKTKEDIIELIEKEIGFICRGTYYFLGNKHSTYWSYNDYSFMIDNTTIRLSTSYGDLIFVANKYNPMSYDDICHKLKIEFKLKFRKKLIKSIL